MLSVVLILICYAVFSADISLAHRFPKPFHYYWIGTAIIFCLYSVVLRDFSEGGQRFENWLLARVPPNPARRIIASPVLPVSLGLAFLVLTWEASYDRLPLIFERPILAWHADMLPTIQNGVSAFLAGENPYLKEWHYSGGVFRPWSVHLPFLPALWLPYLLPEIAGWDYRFLGLACIVAIAGMFYALALLAWSSSRHSSDPRSLLLYCLYTFLLAAGFLLNSRGVSFTPIMHTPPWWLYLAGFCFATITRRFGAASFLLGVCAASRPSAGVLLPFWVFFLLRDNREKLRRRILLLVAPITILVVPFLLWNPGEFLYSTVWAYEVARVRVWTEWPEWVLNTFGITSPLYATGFSGWVLPVQGALLVFLVFLGWRRIRTSNDCLRFMSWALLVFSFTASIPFYYIFIPCFLLLSFSVLADQSRSLKLPMTLRNPSKYLLGGLTLVSVSLVLATAAWSRSLPSQIDFGRTEDRRFLIHGWSGDERWGKGGFSFVWAESKRAAVWLPLRRRSDSLIVFRAFPLNAPTLPAQTMVVMVNGTPQARLQLDPEVQTYRIPAPRQVWLVGNNQIAFEFRYAVAPAQVLPSQDTRTLAVGFDYLSVHPVLPAKER